MIAIGILSPVGGSGRTSLALMTARQLAAQGRDVVLVQTDPTNLMAAQLGRPELAGKGLSQVLGTPGCPVEDCLIPLEDTLRFLPYGSADETQTIELALRTANNPDTLAGIFDSPVFTEHTVLIFDTPRWPSAWCKAVMTLTDLNLVLMVPDANSLLSIDPLMQSLLNGRGSSYFLVNRFDSSHVLHLDIWTLSKIKLSHRLLPFYLHEDPALSECFAAGQHLPDYAPHSQLTEDIQKLVNWIDLEIA
ncbi:MAG: cellulose synthase operon protein YhjQ [Limnobacter sp.]|nr:cellulose synthase operon protein YhjQ [Limnobacter sp.]